MAQENSFDIVSKVDIQEVRNAIDQALKEIRQRFDLKDSHSEVNAGGQRGDPAGLRRGVPSGGGQGDSGAEAGEARGLAEESDLRQAGAGAGQERAAEDQLQQGIPIEKAKEIVRLVKDSKKKAQASIQGDTVRISSKDRDELQSIIACCAAKIWAWNCSLPTTARIERLWGA
jgi:uncharacterized protein YajQ (UPF0234 family)